jgi:hypothetical protein
MVISSNFPTTIQEFKFNRITKMTAQNEKILPIPNEEEIRAVFITDECFKIYPTELSDGQKKVMIKIFLRAYPYLDWGKQIREMGHAESPTNVTDLDVFNYLVGECKWDIRTLRDVLLQKLSVYNQKQKEAEKKLKLENFLKMAQDVKKDLYK